MALPGGDDWWKDVGALLGVGGSGYGIFRLVEILIKRRNKTDDDALLTRKDLDEGLRKDRAFLREDIAELKLEISSLKEEREKDLEESLVAQRLHHEEIIAAQRRYILLERENLALRDRYHRVLDFLQEVILRLDRYTEQLNLGEEARLTIPVWIYERVAGPTQERIVAKPPRGESHAPPHRRAARDAASQRSADSGPVPLQEADGDASSVV